jgi:hypothetical protein
MMRTRLAPAAVAAGLLINGCAFTIEPGPEPIEGDEAETPDPPAPDPPADPAGETSSHCAVRMPSYGDLMSPSYQVAQAVGSEADAFAFAADMDAAHPPDIVTMQFLRGRGAFASAIRPGSYPLAGDELNLETCGLCVIVYGDCDRVTSCPDVYLATGGTVTLTSVAGRLVGSAHDVTFEHVTDPWSPPYVASPVGDGCQSSFSHMTFDTEIQPPQ